MGIIRFLKNWTLPVSIAFGAVVYLIFGYTPCLAGAATALAPAFDTILPLAMLLVLFVTFCKVDFKKLRPVKWHVWVSAFQVLTVGFITALILGFHMKGSSLILMGAMLTCVIGPCAAAAAVVTQKLGGDLEEMTSYTFMSNLVAAVLIPVCFPLIDKHADISFWTAFAIILYKVFIVLVVPMVLAFIVKHWFRSFHQWVIGVKDLAFYLWGVSLTIVSGTTVKNIVHADTTVGFLLTIAVLGLLLCVAQFAVGRYIGHFFHRPISSGQALGQKNTAFAIWIAYTYLNPLSSVGPGCYILWQNIINSVEIWQCRRKEANAPAAPRSDSKP